MILLVLLALLVPAASAAADELPQPGGGVVTGPCHATAAAALPAAPAPVARAAADGPSVKRVLRDAVAEGRLTAEDGKHYEDLYDAALAERRRLTGVRKAELASVIHTLGSFARGGLLTTTRIPVLFELLRRNVDWWSRSGPPAKQATPGASTPCAGGNGTGGNRIVVGEQVFQWYPGEGIQFQQLATFGRANALAKACTEPSDAFPCRPERLRTALDGIVSLAVERGDFLAWEYYFGFGGGKPPWVSGLATATAMQALTRGAQYLKDPRYLEVARRAVGVFRAAPPLGVRVAAPAGDHFLIYSFAPRQRVFNAFLQALVGLYDYAEAANDAEARALFAAGEREARRAVALSDTGAWSRYQEGGAESDLGYHRLLRDVLQSLCDRTHEAVYCATAERFTRYQHERARVELASSDVRARAGRVAPVRFFLSKVSCLTLTVTRGGRPVALVGRVLGRGTRTLAFIPPRAGTYAATLVAKDLNGHRTTVRATVKARR